MVFHLRLVVSFKTRKGKQGSNGLSKELIQGKSIWLVAYKNKIALIISKYSCELGRINKNQAKAIVQAINGGKTHQMIIMMDGSNSHKGKLITFKLSFQNYHDM